MKRMLRSFGYALKGIRIAVHSEANMHIHLAVALLVVLAGLFFSLSTFEWIAVLLCFGFVFSAEIFNSAIETLVNKVSPEQDPLAGRTKDLAAGAVLVAAIFAAAVGLIIFVPKLISLFN